MATTGAKVISAPLISGNDAAPFVYFDGCYVATAVNGEIVLELAARTFMPVSAAPDAPIKVRPVAVAHLRCSAQAARQLCDALDNAVGELERAIGAASRPPEGAKTPSH